MHIRTCTPDDYPSMVAIHNALYPSRPTTVEARLQADRQRTPECKQQAWVALSDGAAGQGDKDARAMAGYGGYAQSPFDYHPQKFQVFVNVLPAHRRQGIGAALYDRLMAGLRPLNPSRLRADCYANLPDGIRFAEKRGFQEVFRETPLLLDVATFDPAPYAGLEGSLRAQGIQIKTVRDLQDDPDRNQKLYDLYWETTRDVPQEGVIAPMPFDEWVKWTLDYPGLSHDGYWVGVCGAEYIGLSEFARKPDTDILQAGLAGVKRTFRRKGVALAIQVRAIAFARQSGCSCIETSTSITNIPMRNLYARLGYVRQPDWLQMEMRMIEDTP